MKISKRVLDQRNEIVRLRRDLHRIPEVAFEEYKTSQYVYSFLETLHPDGLERMCGTGIKAVFGSRLQEPAVAIRADMDALPVCEQTGLPFASQHVGYMHACGHDGHMAMVLTAARIVADNRASLARPYVFIFQPAEETTGGAQPMIEAGVLRNPDVGSIYGLHLWPYIEEGMLGLHAGPLMASMSDINLSIRGRSCHGARPQDGADALVAACQLVSSVQSIVSRNVDPYEAAVITFGRIEGGEARNIVCESVQLEGTLRVFDEATGQRIHERMDSMLRGIDIMFEVHTESTETMSYPAVVNPKAMCDDVRALYAPQDWMDPEPVMISEDFAFYQQCIPGMFAFLGTGAPGRSEPLHSARFVFNEDVLLTGVEYLLGVTQCP